MRTNERGKRVESLNICTRYSHERDNLRGGGSETPGGGAVEGGGSYPAYNARYENRK